MWLEGGHDDYYAYDTFEEFLKDETPKSYLSGLKLVPRSLIDKMLKLGSNIPEGLKLLQSVIINTRGGKASLYGNFEFRIKSSPEMMKFYSQGHIQEVSPRTKSVKVSNNTVISVSIDQESENQHISTEFLPWSRGLASGRLIAQDQDPGWEIVKESSSYAATLAILNDLVLESPFFSARPEVIISYKDESGQVMDLYSTQIAVVSNLDKIKLETSSIFVYRVKIPSNRTNVGKNNMSRMTNGSGVIEIPTRMTKGAAQKGDYRAKFGKLLGDRTQSLTILYYAYCGDPTVILGTGDTSLLNEHNHLFNVMKKTMNRNLFFTCVFDTSIAISTNLAKRKGPSEEIYMFGDTNVFKVVNKPAFRQSVRGLVSRRTQLEKNLRVNIFKSTNNSYKAKPSYMGRGNNIVPRIREALATINKPPIAGTNYKIRMNNVKKRNCNVNGNPLNAPRRAAQKLIVKKMINVASTLIAQGKKPESKNYLNAIGTVLRNYGIEKPPQLRNNQRRNLCSANNVKRVQTRRNIRGNNFSVGMNVTSGSHEGAVAGRNNGNEVVSRPPKRVHKVTNNNNVATVKFSVNNRPKTAKSTKRRKTRRSENN